MSCEEARSMLDAFVDGELTAQQERALMEHAAGCDACGKEMEAAILLRDSLKDMDAEVNVPLEAQAAWRKAVRAEAGRRGRVRRWTRYACGAAAALVLVAGCTFALKGEVFGGEGQLPMARTVKAAQEEGAIIAADGAREAAAGAASAEDAGDECTVWKKYEAEDVEAACESVEALVAEYSGSFGVETDDGAVIYRIELPCDYAEDFLNAVSRIGAELDSRSVELTGDTALICIQIG